MGEVAVMPWGEVVLKPMRTVEEVEASLGDVLTDADRARALAVVRDNRASVSDPYEPFTVSFTPEQQSEWLRYHVTSPKDAAHYTRFGFTPAESAVVESLCMRPEQVHWIVHHTGMDLHQLQIFARVAPTILGDGEWGQYDGFNPFALWFKVIAKVDALIAEIRAEGSEPASFLDVVMMATNGFRTGSVSWTSAALAKTRAAVAAGLTAADVSTARYEGVHSIEGIRLLADGHPTEWVRNYEASQD